MLEMQFVYMNVTPATLNEIKNIHQIKILLTILHPNHFYAMHLSVKLKAGL
jgi:hypothetical protein